MAERWRGLSSMQKFGTMFTGIVALAALCVVVPGVVSFFVPKAVAQVTPMTTPLGCGVHFDTGDSGPTHTDGGLVCTERALIAKSCGVDPTGWPSRSVTAGPRTLDWWFTQDGARAATIEYVLGSDDRVQSVTFICSTQFRTISSQDWNTLITPGMPDMLPSWLQYLHSFSRVDGSCGEVTLRLSRGVVTQLGLAVTKGVPLPTSTRASCPRLPTQPGGTKRTRLLSTCWTSLAGLMRQESDELAV
jgi:hypothetical protein